MKCKACGAKTDKETTKIVLTFSISNPQDMDIQVENDYEHLSMALCITNKKVLHELLDKTLDEIGTMIVTDNIKNSKK